MQNNQDLELREQTDLMLRELEEETKQTSFNIVELLYHLVDKLPVILIVSVLCAAMMFCWIYFFTPTEYQATTKMYVLTGDTGSLTGTLLSQFQVGSYLTSDYRQVFTNKEVHDQVMKEMKEQGVEKEYSYRQLERMLSITNPGEGRVLVVKVTSEDQAEARLLAEAYAKAAEGFIENRMERTLPEQRFEKVYSEKVSKNTVQNTLLVFVAAFLAMAAIYSVAFVMDDRITSKDAVEKRVGVVALGMMPLLDEDGKSAGKKKKNGRKDR